MKTLILLLLLCFTLNSYACEDFYSSPHLQNVLQSLKTSRVAPVWQDYRPSDNATILTDLESHPKCILLVNGEIVSKHELKNELHIRNQLYTFYSPWDEPKDEINELLLSLQLESAVLFSIHNYIGAETATFPGGHLGLTTSNLFHEGFHNFGQFQSPIWPRWIFAFADYDHRRTIQDNCYAANIGLLEQEKNILLEAFERRENRSELISGLKNYISLRDSRYSQKPECEENVEAAFEMMEGAAEYVGLQTILTQGLTTMAEIIKFRRENHRPDQVPEYYYTSGSVSLFLMTYLQPNILTQDNPFIGVRTTDDSIYKMLKKMVTALQE